MIHLKLIGRGLQVFVAVALVLAVIMAVVVLAHTFPVAGYIILGLIFMAMCWVLGIMVSSKEELEKMDKMK